MNVVVPYLADFLMLIVGGFFYLYSRSVFWTKDEDKRSKWESFRKENVRIMRIGGLLLLAISAVNLFLAFSA